MFLMYVDESGDLGQSPGSSPFFALSGVVVHDSLWLATLDSLIVFRRGLRTTYGLPMRDELHASVLMNKGGSVSRLQRHQRLRLLRDVLDFEAITPALSILSVVVDKADKPAGYPIFDYAWERLITRFQKTISHGNFPGSKDRREHGIVVADEGNVGALRTLMRRMRRHNLVPLMYTVGQSISLPTRSIVEDAVHRDSKWSYFVQLADINAYFLFQHYCPNHFVLDHGARNYYGRLLPVLCLVAARNKGHRWGVVEI